MPTQIRSNHEEILFEAVDHIAIITLNRPERMNAISRPMLQALSALLTDCQGSRDVRVVILTGAGRGFCVGLDLVDVKNEGIGSEKSRQEGYKGLFDLRDSPPMVMYRMDKPLICALNGPAAGYGMDLALLCDIRIAGQSAKMAPVFAKRGILPESGGSWILPRMLGWAKAAEIAFRGRVLSSEESLNLGLVNRVVPDGELMDISTQWASEIAANAPLAIQATKRMMRLGLEETFETAVDHVYLQLLPLFASHDFKEGVNAFQEKREPKFEGR